MYVNSNHTFKYKLEKLYICRRDWSSLGTGIAGLGCGKRDPAKLCEKILSDTDPATTLPLCNYVPISL
jgi:hypothetical protein